MKNDKIDLFAKGSCHGEERKEGATCFNVVGQSVDRKSSVCPNPVKGLSNHEEKYRVCPIKYRVCQESVESLSNEKDLGQRLETKIQYLSRHCPNKKILRG